MIPLINCFQRLWFTTFLVHLFNFFCRSFSYEKKYREAVESKSAGQIKDERVQEGPTKVETTSKVEVKEANPQSTTSTSSSTEQDLDVFLLGEAGDSDDDDGPGAYILVNFVAAAVLKNGCYIFSPELFYPHWSELSPMIRFFTACICNDDNFILLIVDYHY